MPKKNTIQQPENDPLIETIRECHHLSPKRAAVFAKQARALQKNLELRRQQQEKRKELAEQSSSQSGE